MLKLNKSLPYILVFSFLLLLSIIFPLVFTTHYIIDSADIFIIAIYSIPITYICTYIFGPIFTPSFIIILFSVSSVYIFIISYILFIVLDIINPLALSTLQYYILNILYASFSTLLIKIGAHQYHELH